MNPNPANFKNDVLQTGDLEIEKPASLSPPYIDGLLDLVRVNPRIQRNHEGIERINFLPSHTPTCDGFELDFRSPERALMSRSTLMPSASLNSAVTRFPGPTPVNQLSRSVCRATCWYIPQNQPNVSR
jgi:hypothetical protein